ncbi:MAG: DUF1080 domain-containing protein [Puniceicoccales bacterium]|jgi:hypothetical protein|nr:DUF1080 domain-containing protein [Puniceicoccales bacterium]
MSILRFSKRALLAAGTAAALAFAQTGLNAAETAAELAAKVANKGRPEIQGGMHAVKKVPGKCDTTPPPAGAIVLFDGTAASVAANWRPENAKNPAWPVNTAGALVAANKTDLLTQRAFGSLKLHLEWRVPADRKGISGQRGANSGVIFMPRGWYEVQILESHGNPGNTYSDGMAGAIYQRSTPAANPALPQGEWQSYDITFLAPKFGEKGEVLRKPRFTVVFNGVVVQDNVELDGNTLRRNSKLSKHPVPQPFKLQYHNDPIEFRNIWAVEIAE